MQQALSIHPIEAAGFDEFFAYLNDHLQDNGKQVYFQPMPRAQTRAPVAMVAAFRDALLVPVGELGWRRAWVARDAEGAIAGHVDVRALPERVAAHRCMLGMGVHRAHRQRGLGATLLAHVEAWLLGSTAVDWIDLQVLSMNAPALRLYRGAGFVTTGEVADMFRIDGQSFAYTYMSKQLAR